MNCALDGLLNLQELHCTCLSVLDYQHYCLSVSSDLSLATSLTISLVSSFPFPCLAISGSLVATFLASMQVIVMQCRDLALPKSLLFATSPINNNFLMHTSCAVSRILVLQFVRSLALAAYFARQCSLLCSDS